MTDTLQTRSALHCVCDTLIMRGTKPPITTPQENNRKEQNKAMEAAMNTECATLMNTRLWF